MMSPEANLKLAQRASWSGYVYIGFLMVGIWMLARFFPSQPPTWNAEQINAVYHENTAMLKLGMVLVLVGSMFYVPWTAMLATLISRVEGRAGILTYCQIIAGGANVLLTAYPAGWWLTAAYRSDRDAELVLLLNDIAWLQFLGVIAPFYFVVISIIYASFADRAEDPLIPRWVGYFNVFFMFELIPLSIIFFFKSGPFAWNGLFGFYAPFVTFWVWFIVMTYTIRRSLSPERMANADSVTPVTSRT